MDYPKVKIIMPDGIAVQGTRIEVDGVDQRAVRKATLVLEAGSVAMLTLEHFGSVEMQGGAEVEHVNLCAECKSRLVNTGVVACDVTDMGDTWRRFTPTDDALLAAARVAIKENKKLRTACEAHGIDIVSYGVGPDWSAAR